MVEILDRQQAPARHRLDVGAYYKMAEAGISRKTTASS